MQAHQFSNGGYVAHKVRVNANVSPMYFSVWFSAQGELTDCEAFDKAGRARPVPAKVRKVLATMYGWVVAAARQLPATTRPGDQAAVYAAENGVDYLTALSRCNMD